MINLRIIITNVDSHKDTCWKTLCAIKSLWTWTDHPSSSHWLAGKGGHILVGFSTKSCFLVCVNLGNEDPRGAACIQDCPKTANSVGTGRWIHSVQYHNHTLQYIRGQSNVKRYLHYPATVRTGILQALSPREYTLQYILLLSLSARFLQSPK